MPPGFDFSLAQLSRREAIDFWRRKGVAPMSGALDDDWGEASLFVPAGARGPVFLVSRNFHALLRYNTAPAYALAVSRLAARFENNAAPFQTPWPVADRPLLPEELVALQSLLSKAGYKVSIVDGVLGPETRAAVRAFQRDANLVEDGYATPGLLVQLRRHLR